MSTQAAPPPSTSLLRSCGGCLLLVYLAVTLHMAVLWWLGGMPRVPLVVVGACQYVPGLLVVALVPGWRRRLVQLLTTWPRMRELVGWYLLTVVTVGACILLPYFAGHHQHQYGPSVTDSYPLRDFVPAPLLVPSRFWIFLLVAGPLLHGLNALGEEILWRGYLLDKLVERLPRLKAYLVNGVLWGIWHTPMIVLLGWDFPGHPLLGTLAITGSQIFWSVVMCHARQRSNSLWPPVVMHATANAMTIGFFDRLVDHQQNLLFSPWGLAGGVLMALFSLPILLGRPPSTAQEAK